jgi:hypothetical protein
MYETHEQSEMIDCAAGQIKSHHARTIISLYSLCVTLVFQVSTCDAGSVALGPCGIKSKKTFISILESSIIFCRQKIEFLPFVKKKYLFNVV